MQWKWCVTLELHTHSYLPVLTMYFTVSVDHIYSYTGVKRIFHAILLRVGICLCKQYRNKARMKTYTCRATLHLLWMWLVQSNVKYFNYWKVPAKALMSIYRGEREIKSWKKSWTKLGIKRKTPPPPSPPIASWTLLISPSLLLYNEVRHAISWVDLLFHPCLVHILCKGIVLHVVNSYNFACLRGNHQK